MELVHGKFCHIQSTVEVSAAPTLLLLLLLGVEKGINFQEL